MMKNPLESAVSRPHVLVEVFLRCNVFPRIGYYLATLEAATTHIVDLAEQFEEIDKADQLFNEQDYDGF